MICKNCPYYLSVNTNTVPIYYCEKLQGDIDQIECCEDRDKDKCIYENKPKRKRKSTRERDLKYKARLKRQAKLYHGADYQEGKYIIGKGFIPVKTPYYRRVYHGKHTINIYNYYKKQANRCVRNFNGVIPKGMGYKKVFDYWWTVD